MFPAQERGRSVCSGIRSKRGRSAPAQCFAFFHCWCSAGARATARRKARSCAWGAACRAWLVCGGLRASINTPAEHGFARVCVLVQNPAEHVFARVCVPVQIKRPPVHVFVCISGIYVYRAALVQMSDGISFDFTAQLWFLDSLVQDSCKMFPSKCKPESTYILPPHAEDQKITFIVWDKSTFDEEGLETGNVQVLNDVGPSHTGKVRFEKPLKSSVVKIAAFVRNGSVQVGSVMISVEELRVIVQKGGEIVLRHA